MIQICSRTAITLSMLLVILFGQTQQLSAQTTQFIPSSAFAAFDCKPKDAFAQPGLELVPRELITVFGKQELGLDLLELTRVTFLVGEIKDPEMKDPPEFGVIARFASPQSLSEKITDRFEKTSIDGKTAFENDEVSLIQTDDKTVLIGSHEFLRKMLSAEGATSPLILIMKEARASDHVNAYVMLEPIRALLKKNLPDRKEVPPPFRNFLKIPDLVGAVTYRGDFSDNSVSEYMIRAIDDDSIEKLQQLIGHGFDLAKNAALSAMTTQMEIPEAYQEAALAYAERVSKFLESAIQPKVDGRDMVFDVNQGQGVGSIGTMGVMVGMLLPAVQQVREAARRTSSMNNLRQLVLTAHNYHAATNHFPMNANYDEDGNPLLSWRGHLLPFLDQQTLYERFHLDEPWDSPHNIELLELMPPTYANPNANLLPGETVYLAISGPGTVFPGNQKMTFANIADGTSNTAMLVEADASLAVAWTRPQDLAFDPDDPLLGLGSLRPAGFVCALCDGSVRIVSGHIDPEVWKSLVLTNDGQ